MLKALDIVGLSQLTHLFSVVLRSETGPEEWQTGWWFLFLKRGIGGCAPIIGVSHCLASLAKLIPGWWKGGSTRLTNLRYRRNNVDLVIPAGIVLG